MRGNPRICIRVEKDTLSELQCRAAADGVSVSELVRSIIEEWLDMYS